MKPGSTALPSARMVGLSPPSFSVISSHSAAVEVSHHSLAGRMTSPSLSSGTKPCCWPLTPMALTSAAAALAWRSARRMAPAVASRQVWGCCSLAPGGRLGIRSYSCAAEARTFPSRASTTRTLVDCVPLSMPSKSVLIAGLIQKLREGERPREPKLLRQLQESGSGPGARPPDQDPGECRTSRQWPARNWWSRY